MSEETEVKKNIEWLKDEILTDMRYLEGNRDIQQLDIKYQTLREVAQKIHSLDEPETLSQEWIDEHVDYADVRGGTQAFIHVEDLQNLLVPEKEELEAKIQELIESYKQEEDAYSNPENGWISGFIDDLQNLLEEEQKYYIELLNQGTGAYLEYYPKSGNYGVTGHKDSNKGVTKFTEQEIKDYDERFWAFAIPVEELEE